VTKPVSGKMKASKAFNREFNTLSARRRKGAQVMPGVNLSDAVFAAMAKIPNPEPQEWFNDSSKLPKKPPSERKQ
jgi:hypothetical protein